jgi:hypothetical protein
MESNRNNETKLDEIRSKIEHYRDQIEHNRVKVTLKETINESEVGVIPAGFTLQPKKTVVYRDIAPVQAGAKKDQPVAGPVIPINCVTFN